MSHSGTPAPATASRSENLRGTVRIPGDKSISHRYALFSGLNQRYPGPMRHRFFSSGRTSASITVTCGAPVTSPWP